MPDKLWRKSQTLNFKKICPSVWALKHIDRHDLKIRFSFFDIVREA